jgi:hypothetical protein
MRPVIVRHTRCKVVAVTCNCFRGEDQRPEVLRARLLLTRLGPDAVDSVMSLNSGGCKT